MRREAKARVSVNVLGDFDLGPTRGEPFHGALHGDGKARRLAADEDVSRVHGRAVLTAFGSDVGRSWSEKRNNFFFCQSKSAQRTPFHADQCPAGNDPPAEFSVNEWPLMSARPVIARNNALTLEAMAPHHTTRIFHGVGRRPFLQKQSV